MRLTVRRLNKSFQTEVKIGVTTCVSYILNLGSKFEIRGFLFSISNKICIEKLFKKQDGYQAQIDNQDDWICFYVILQELMISANKKKYKTKFYLFKII